MNSGGVVEAVVGAVVDAESCPSQERVSLVGTRSVGAYPSVLSLLRQRLHGFLFGVLFPMGCFLGTFWELLESNQELSEPHREIV